MRQRAAASLAGAALGLGVLVTPFVVWHRFEPNLPEALHRFFPGGQGADLFYGGKSVVTVVAGALGCVALALRAAARGHGGLPSKRRFSRSVRGSLSAVHAFIAVLTLCAIASSLRAPSLDVAWRGAPESYETIPVLGAWIALLATAVAWVRPDRLRTVWAGLAVAVLAMAGVLITEAADHVIFLWPGIGDLIGIPRTAAGEFAVAPTGMLGFAATLANSNYLGSYAAMTFPLLFAVSVQAPQGNARPILVPVAAVVAFWLGMVSLSRAGLAAMGCGLIFVLAALTATAGDWRRAAWRRAGALLMGCAVTWGAWNAVAEGRLGERVSSLGMSVGGLWRAEHSRDEGRLRIEAYGQALRLRFEGRTLVVMPRAGRLAFLTGEGEDIPFREEMGEFQPAFPGFSDMRMNFVRDGRLLLVHVKGPPALGKGLTIAATPEGMRVLRGGALLRPKPVVAWDLPGMSDETFSARGYIWRRTLPMLFGEGAPWLGTGPGSFLLRFPDGDVAAQANIFHSWDVIVDKPHNMYLGWVTSIGASGLLAVLGLLALAFAGIASENWAGSPRFPLMAALVGAMVEGLANDLVVPVAPLFWVGLGLTLGLRREAGADPTVAAVE